MSGARPDIKLERVRVEGSKNSVQTVLPASAPRNAVPP